MIRRINLKCASYKELTSLETDKKFNLIIAKTTIYSNILTMRIKSL